jgi:ABC-2 type transport system ATP-binding protein
MILVQNVSVALDGTPILHDISFEIQTGTVAGYVGQNGAGKTTTMRLLTGALAPDAGRVVVGGADVVAQPLEAKRRFGYVPEHGHLYESFTPVEYLAFIGRMHGLDEAVLARRTAAHLGFWGLADAAAQSMTGFSKGMKQKILVSAALLHDPPVLLLDEPLGGLDAHAVLQMRALLRTLVARGKTVFYSSHLLDAVEKVADQVVVIREGRILQTGTPAEITQGAGGASLEDAFGRLTAAADAYDEAEALVAEAFAS